jgi:hypothetical protein
MMDDQRRCCPWGMALSAEATATALNPILFVHSVHVRPRARSGPVTK